MKVVYVVESMELSGGVKDIVEQAEGLARRGHDVSIVTRNAHQSWIDVAVPVLEVPIFDATTIPPADVHIATWFPTVVPAVRARSARAVLHFCQGYEELYPNCAGRLSEVEEAYSQPVPKLLLSSHLAAVLARFPGPKWTLGPAIRLDLYEPSPGKAKPADVPTIGVVGPFELSIKGIDVALRAVARLDRTRRVRLIRASQLPQSDGERTIRAADVYSHCASVAEMTRWYRECDLLIHGSWPAEGLGLPPFEAMASGVPVVATDIPSLQVLSDAAVSKVPPGDDEAMAREAERILGDPALWAARREQGLMDVPRFGISAALDRLEGFLARAVGGASV